MTKKKHQKLWHKKADKIMSSKTLSLKNKKDAKVQGEALSFGNALRSEIRKSIEDKT